MTIECNHPHLVVIRRAGLVCWNPACTWSAQDTVNSGLVRQSTDLPDKTNMTPFQPRERQYRWGKVFLQKSCQAWDNRNQRNTFDMKMNWSDCTAHCMCLKKNSNFTIVLFQNITKTNMKTNPDLICKMSQWMEMGSRILNCTTAHCHCQQGSTNLIDKTCMLR